MNPSPETTEQATARLNRVQLFAYALPSGGVYFLLGPLAILQGIYAKYFSIPLTTIAVVLLISKMCNAISAPLIGYLSDRHHFRGGSRKPFVISGGVMFIICSYFLYVPFDFSTMKAIELDGQMTASVSASYFLGCFVAFYVTFTVFEIPHLGWGGELGVSSHGKNEVYAWRVMCIYIGTLVFYAIPLLPTFKTSAFTPQTLKWSVLAVSGFMLPVLYFCYKKVPNANVAHSPNDLHNPKEIIREPLKSLWLSIGNNYPLLFFLAAFFCAGIGIGMWFALVFLFVDVFLGLGQYFAPLFVASYGVSIFSLSWWPKVANSLGKQWCWGLAMILSMTGLLGSSVLTSDQADFTTLTICMSTIFSGLIAISFLGPSLLGDIVDYSIWKFGHDRAGIYFSLYTLVGKANAAIGGALGLGIAGLYGFDVASTTQGAEAVFGMRLSMVWLPVPAMLLSIVFIMLIPINSRTHAIVRRRLDSRKPNEVNRIERVIHKVQEDEKIQHCL